MIAGVLTALTQNLILPPSIVGPIAVLMSLHDALNDVIRTSILGETDAMRRIVQVTCCSVFTTVATFSGIAAPTLLVNESGVLTGAKNVLVDDRRYGVEFVDGTCASLYRGCDDDGDFGLSNVEEANAAFAALLETVFVDSSLGSFGSRLDLVRGCAVQ